jgi:ketosteroid isomerase-like protein
MNLETFKAAIALTFAVLVIMFGSECRPASATQESPTREGFVHHPDPGAWMRLVNAGSDSLTGLYTPEAVHIDETGGVVTGAAAISESLRQRQFKIDSVTTSYGISATPDAAYRYELGSFYTSDRKIYKHLLIRDTRNGQFLRELEFIAPAEKGAKVATGIAERRKEWIRLCNLHNPAALVTGMYAENAVYYNHRPVVTGRDGILADYQYMSDPNYTLSLEPLILEAVTDALVFEIGQCSGSYNGKYILVWQKNTEGEWQVLMDSNI